ncbi:hypothetical protein EB796_022926 [Bugula neritina]|uniref:Reelin domain-containing protein n=1 Tax=Bugula neritina TaxID=10212 RepID=A0A7J7IZD0_BUGNE|nr:hypothetical protein EB796_022926 [Bugula neritina]
MNQLLTLLILLVGVATLAETQSTTPSYKITSTCEITNNTITVTIEMHKKKKEGYRGFLIAGVDNSDRAEMLGTFTPPGTDDEYQVQSCEGADYATHINNSKKKYDLSLNWIVPRKHLERKCASEL